MAAVLMAASLFSLFHCLSADQTGFSLVYNGGRIMTEPVTVSLLWIGNGWAQTDQEVIRNAIVSLTPLTGTEDASSPEVPTLENWWDVVRQYTDGSNMPVTDSVSLGAECFYRGSSMNMTSKKVDLISQAAFNRTAATSLLMECTGEFQVSPNSIFHVVFSNRVLFSNTKEQEDFINLCSGHFSMALLTGETVRVVWARAPQSSGDMCSLPSDGRHFLGMPNGNEGADSLVGHILGRIATEVTNNDGKGWVSNDGNRRSIATSCDQLFQTVYADLPLFSDPARNTSFNAIGSNAFKYILHYVWDRSISNCALRHSVTCEEMAITMNQPKGQISEGFIVNHTNGLQPYPPNQKCQWKIHNPEARFINFNINYLSIPDNKEEGSLVICPSNRKDKQCTYLQSSSGNSLKLMGSNAYIEFRSGRDISSETRGWELTYSAGLCNGKKDIYENEGVLSYGSLAEGVAYTKGLTCQWVLHGKPGTPVSLNFTRINITKQLDFLAVYGGDTTQQIANYSGDYSNISLPMMDLTGKVTVVFATQTDEGLGWSAKFRIQSPVERRRSLWLLVIGAVLGVVAILCIATLITVLVRRKRHWHTHVSKRHIKIEVRNLQDNQIGEGQNSIVYKTKSARGSLVAVKSLKYATLETALEEEILRKASSHPNIISIIGHGHNRTCGRCLVFELQTGGNLACTLREQGESLNWGKRIDIATQISSAIQMLHMYMNPPVIHGCITSENVLLSENNEAKLGGFGGAKYSKIGGSTSEKEFEMGKDIKDFGMLIMELLQGEKPVNKEDLESVINFDKKIEYPKDQFKIMSLAKFGEIGRWCIDGARRIEEEKNSPQIVDVVMSLKQVKQLYNTLPT